MNEIMDEVAQQSLKNIYGKDIPLERATGGVLNDVYFFEINGQKEVIKILNLNELFSEIFFLTQAEKAESPVPRVQNFGQIDKNKGFYTMNFIEGHKDINQNPQGYITALVDSIKKIHQVKLSGFGQFISTDLEHPQFEAPTLYAWLDIEAGRLKALFGKFQLTDKIELVDFVVKNLPKLVENTKDSVLVQGDIGFRNTFYDGEKVYLFDTGKNRAMPALWEVASFDQRFFKDPQEGHYSELFKKFYFPNGITPEEDKIIAAFRAMVILEKHFGRLKNGNFLQEPFKSRVERNIQAFKEKLASQGVPFRA